MFALLQNLVAMLLAAHIKVPLVTCREALGIFNREWTQFGVDDHEMKLCSYPENMRLVLEACNEEEHDERSECTSLPSRLVEEARDMLRGTAARYASISVRDNCLVLGKTSKRDII
jgi:hypothetical protein